VVGTALFRDSFLGRAAHGHADVDRLASVGVNVVGLTVATRWPNLRGSLSGWHFRSLGMPGSALRTNLATAEWLIGRIEGWVGKSDGRLRVLRTAEDLDACLAPGGPIGVLIGVQGAHALDADLANLARLREAGVRMFAPAHVMDNEAVGSSTGLSGAGLTDYGRELVGELEAQSIIVDLAHMSVPGIEAALPLLNQPFTLSHTGFTDLAGGRSRLRRFSPATRNVPSSLAAEVGRAGGLVGVVLSTQLLDGDTLDRAVAALRLGVESAGAENVAIGSDMDGALKMVIDVEGLPALADALLASDLNANVVRGVMGANAVRVIRAALR
jgi:microsomal dipeptidase-like Zn-dependent dipeptidase